MMENRQEVIDALQQIDDGALLSLAEDDLTDRAYDALAVLSFQGIVLRAPQQVDLSQQGPLPVLAAISQSGERAADIPMPDNAILICTRFGSRGRWLSPLFPTQFDKIPPLHQPIDVAQPVLEETDVPLSITAVEYLDLQQMGVGSSTTGLYDLRVISWDWLSNTVIIEVDNAEKPSDSHFEPFAASGGEPSQEKQTDAGPVPSLPCFEETPLSPTVEPTGIALSVPSSPVALGQPIPVYGTSRLPFRAEMGQAREDSTLIVPGILVLARKGILNPILLDIDIPLVQDAPSSTHGWFAYDLNMLAGNSLPAAEYRVYVLAAGHSAGPYVLEVVTSLNGSQPPGDL